MGTNVVHKRISAEYIMLSWCVSKHWGIYFSAACPLLQREDWVWFYCKKSS